MLDAILLPYFTHQPVQHLSGLTMVIGTVHLKALARFVYYLEGLHKSLLDVLYSKSTVSDIICAIQGVENDERILEWTQLLVLAKVDLIPI